MDKIKDKNAKESFFGLENLLFSEPLERIKMHLVIAKNLFILTAAFYFLSLLTAVAWAFLPLSAQITFFLYPLFVFSVLWLVYNLISYAIVVYFEKLLFLRYPLFLFFTIIFSLLIAKHLGFFTFLLSFLWKN